jgi:aminoglycoside 6-adenylyltransferase
MEQILERCIAWAKGESGIQALAIVGSRARNDVVADEWSDLDLIVVVDDPESYLTRTDWLLQIGHPWLTFLEPTPIGGLLERRVLFDGLHDVDWTFIPVSMVEDWRDHGVPDEVVLVFQRGVRTLLDRTGAITEMLASVSTQPRTTPTRPTPDQYHHTVNDFLYHVIWCSKKLQRGEVWIAKHSCDGYLKRLLLVMVDWHAQSQHGWALDTWHGGRFLERWAEPEAVRDLPGTFAAYAPADIQRALVATLALFQQLAMTVADNLGLHYPEDAHSYVKTWIEQYHPE